MDNSLSPTGFGATRLGYIGSVMDVIAGKMSPELDGKVFNARDYLCGFLLASPRDKFSLGEAVIVNGNCYTTATDKTAPDYNKTIHGSKFVTSSVFLIPPDAQPSYKLKLNSDSPALAVPIMDLYQKIYNVVKQPLAFFGMMEIANLSAIAIGKTPIDGLNIFEHQKEYYPNPAITTKNVSVFTIGVLTDYTQNEFADINRQLEVVLYRTTHPGNTYTAANNANTTITNHAHLLTLKHSLTNISAIVPEAVEQVLHLFPDGTIIANASLDIFTIDGLDNYLDRKGLK